MNQIARYNDASNKATSESADLAKKIADKRKKRNDAYLKLQKEQQNEQKKQDKKIKNMQKSYERKITDLSSQMMGSLHERVASVTPEINVSNFEEELQYDVFVSHAWEDKEDFVEEFIQELRDLEIRVWYDKSRIKWGDSMRAKIDEGLKKGEFRKKVGISEGTLSKLSRNENVSMDVIVKMCREMNCTVDEIMDVLPSPVNGTDKNIES